MHNTNRDLTAHLAQAQAFLDARREKHLHFRMEEGDGNEAGEPGQEGDDSDKESENPDQQKREDKGFPADTPLAEMTVEQREAYWKDKARKHENRANQYSDYDQQKADAEKWRQMQEEQKTPAQKLIDEARADERAKVRAETNNEISTAMLRTTLGVRGKDAEQVNQILSTTNLDAFVVDGAVDADRVTAYAELIAGPVTGGTQQWSGSGQGTTSPPPTRLSGKEIRAKYLTK